MDRADLHFHGGPQPGNRNSTVGSNAVSQSKLADVNKFDTEYNGSKNGPFGKLDYAPDKGFEIMTVQDRALMPDYLRLIALFGIVIVNVQFIAFSALRGFTEPAGETFSDAVTLWLVNGLALLKTYGLFSFMFGVGLGFLMRSAEQRSLPFGRIYRNRMIGLLLLGLAPGCLLFPGDILVIYAVTGTILYFFRSWTAARLVKVGAILLIAQLGVMGLWRWLNQRKTRY